MSWSEEVELGEKVALVTGGSEGIGRAVAVTLAAAGATVVLTSRDGEKAEEVAAALSDESGGTVVGHGCDARSHEACLQMAEAIGERFGRLDILVNNAGLGVFKPIQEMSAEEWLVQVETNLNGVFFTTKACLPLLLEAGDGGEGDAWLINVGSLASRNTFGGGAGYNASKFGLLGMSEAMMIDLRHEGIRTSILMPGSVNTGFGGHGEREWPLQPEDIARAVLQLIAYPTNALVSRMEMRPSRPPR
jgi:NAD(P)-dependent dehydrogenase (short-subunit alcohol dehydrogenase family)